MSYSPIAGDVWLDGSGRHWHCKVVNTEEHVGEFSTCKRMVHYLDIGFHMMPEEVFTEKYPEARLYLRQGHHLERQ